MHTVKLTELQFAGVASGAAPTIFIDSSRIDILPKQYVLLYECAETINGGYKQTGRVLAGLVTSVFDGYPMCSEYRAVTVKKVAELVELRQ